MITIVLIEPEHPGNVGAIVRAMANFGFRELVLIDPKCDHLSEEARCRAKNEQFLLESAVVASKQKLEEFDYLIGTTAKMGTDYNIPRSPLTPDQLAEKISPLIEKEARIALILGREGIGLLNEEVALCDFIVTIPTSKEYRALNLSHAAVVLFYEISKAFGKNTITEHIPPIGKGEKDALIKLIDSILNDMDFTTEEKRETQKTLWRRVLGKAMLTNREAQVVMGFMRKVEQDGKGN